LEPYLAQSHWYLMKTYKAAGEYELAFSELNEIKSLGFSWQGDPSSLKEGIGVLEAVGVSKETLVDFYERGTELDPKDYFFWMKLAESYAVLGQKEKAVNAAENILELKPELSLQIEQFLEKLED